MLDIDVQSIEALLCNDRCAREAWEQSVNNNIYLNDDACKFIMNLLYTMKENPPIAGEASKMIEEKLNLSDNTTRKRIKILVENGFIKKEVDKIDARKKYMMPTNKLIDYIDNYYNNYKIIKLREISSRINKDFDSEDKQEDVKQAG